MVRNVVVKLGKLKRIIDKDSSIKLIGGFFYDGRTVYHLDGDMNKARDYFFGLQDRIIKIYDREKIKELVWDKRARNDLADGRLLYNGRVYDGGEFAKQEAGKRREEEMKKLRRQSLEETVRVYNFIAEKKVKEIYDNYKVKITREAKEKAHRIAERMVDLTGPNEITLEGVDFIGREENPAIRDVYISDGQIAAPTTCGRMSSKDMLLTSKNLEESGKKRFAWIHSHANMSAYHSSTDDGNLESKISLFGNKIDLEISSFGFKIPLKLKIYPSLVFNARRDEPYVEVGIQYTSLELSERLGFHLNSAYTTKKKAPLEILGESNNIDLSESIINREINERVTWYGKPIPESLRQEIFERTGMDMSNPSYKINSFKDLDSWRNTHKSEKMKSPQPYKSKQETKSFTQEAEDKNEKSLVNRMLGLEKGYNKLLGLYNNLSSRIDNHVQL